MDQMKRVARPFALAALALLLPAARAQQVEKVATDVPAQELPAHKMEELRGDIAMAKKFYGDAISQYQKALQIEPRNATLLNKIGIAYHQQMQWNNAKKYYERAIRADKTHAFAVNNLGMVHYHKKKWKNAAKEFHRALELRADLPAVESNLGHAYFMMKKYDEAFSAFGRALALDPQVFERRTGNAGSILQDRSVEDRAQYYFFLARTFASINDIERCAQYLLKARDENYRGLLSIEKDPAFAAVVKDDRIQEFLVQTRTLAQTQTRKE